MDWKIGRIGQGPLFSQEGKKLCAVVCRRVGVGRRRRKEGGREGGRAALVRKARQD